MNVTEIPINKIILPKRKVIIEDSLIFLAGPVFNAPPWHDKAIEIMRSMDEHIYIASPHKRTAIFENDFSHQLDWEVSYLEQASENGVILFWLPVAQNHNCDRSYARDTRGELGEWRGRMKYNKNIKIVIGGEEGFDGLDIIKRNFLRINPNMKFFSTLEETCLEALKIVRD